MFIYSFGLWDFPEGIFPTYIFPNFKKSRIPFFSKIGVRFRLVKVSLANNLFEIYRYSPWHKVLLWASSFVERNFKLLL